MIKVLELNDGIHDSTYVALGTYFGNLNDFLKELAQPHDVFYSIKRVELENIEWEGDIEELNAKFDLLASYRTPTTLYNINRGAWYERVKIFDELWELGDKIC